MKWLLALVVSAACASLGQSASEPATGKLVGHVEIGPLRPVERPGEKVKVPPEMYRTYTVIVSVPGPQRGPMKSHLLRPIKQLKLTDNGDFSTDLQPGKYHVALSSTKPARGMPAPQSVEIKAGATTRMTFKVDTGIR